MDADLRRHCKAPMRIDDRPLSGGLKELKILGVAHYEVAPPRAALPQASADARPTPRGPGVPERREQCMRDCLGTDQAALG